jgi:hypothetical protein
MPMFGKMPSPILPKRHYARFAARAQLPGLIVFPGKKYFFLRLIPVSRSALLAVCWD